VTRRYPARRTLKGARFLTIALLLTALFGVVIAAEGEPFGWAVLSFGALFGALVVLQSLRPWWRYSIAAEGIEIHRLLGTRLLSRAEILRVEQVDGARLEEVLAGPRGVDLRAGIRARREIGRIVTFVTVPVVMTQTVRGGPQVVRALRTRALGQFVLVTLADGTMKALSPRDVPGFVKTWEESAA
jgi:hypothetical protein